MKHLMTTKKSRPIIVLLGLIVCVLVYFQQETFAFSNGSNASLNNALLACIVNKDEKCVEQALISGASPDAQDNNGMTALMAASNTNYYNENIIKLLVDYKADLNKQDPKGITALMIAANDNRLFVVELLLKKGADPNKVNNEDETALFFATYNGHTDIAIELLDKGANPDLKLKRFGGSTVIMIAMQKKYHDIVAALIKNKATLGVGQLRLFYNLRLFVDQYLSKTAVFKNNLQNTEGHCAGLTKLWLYSKLSSEKKLGNYTNQWFLDTITDIAMWDGKKALDKNTIQNFEKFLDLVTLFQDSSYHDLNIPQTNFKALLNYSGLPVNNNELDEEYTIASTITLGQLTKILEEITRENKLIIIYSLDPMAHAVALYKEANHYYYYDPNITKGEIYTSLTKEVAKNIFDSFSFGQIAFPAIGFIIYDLNDNNYNHPLSAMFPICRIYANALPICDIEDNSAPLITYPNQSIVLNKLKPAISEKALFPSSFIGCLESTKYFLYHNALVDTVIGKNKTTALMIAAQNTHFDVANELLANRANPNLQDINGKTALMFASRSGAANIVSELLNYNAYINTQDNDGMTALMFASNFGFIDIVELLLKNKADPNIKANNGKTALILAAINGHAAIIDRLIDKGANADSQLPDGVNALMVAANKGYINVINTLLIKGANLNLTQKTDDSTALMEALFFNHTDIAIALLDAGAKPNLQRNDGATALMIAVEKGYTDVIEKLLAKGADPDLKTKSDGSTALIKTLFSGYPDIAIILLNGGAKPNLQRNDGVSALMMAAYKGYKDVVVELLNRHADATLTTKINGLTVTAKDIARSNNHIDIVNLLP